MSTLTYGLDWEVVTSVKKSVKVVEILHIVQVVRSITVNRQVDTRTLMKKKEKDLNSCVGGKDQPFTSWIMTFPASSPFFLQSVSDFSSFCVLDISHHVVSRDGACILLCSALEVPEIGRLN